MISHEECVDFERLRADRDFYRQLLSLSGQADLEPLLREALSLIVKVTGAQSAYLEIGPSADDAGQRWWLAHGMNEPDIEAVRSSISRGIIAESMATGQVIRTVSALTDPRFQHRESVKRHGIQAVLCAPVGRDPLLGVVYLQGRDAGGRFDENDEERVSCLARQLAALSGMLLQRRDRAEQQDHTRRIRSQFRCDSMVGRSSALAATLQQAALVAPLDIPVIITGASGTGKTALARIIADNSRRRLGPFLELNCAALPEGLLESELFGAARGAHSTATRALPGKVAAAAGGTLFLDEVAELSLGAQAKLLQLLQSGLYFSLGASEPSRSDARIVCATNVDLHSALAARRFREDLFYRLHVLPVQMPTLAERRSDIREIADHLFAAARERHGLAVRALSASTSIACQEAAWPGNIRQLAHAIEAAAIRAQGDGCCEVELHHLFPDRASGSDDGSCGFQQATRSFQRELLLRTLEALDWNVSAAARKLDLTRAHVYNLIQAHGLHRRDAEQGVDDGRAHPVVTA